MRGNVAHISLLVCALFAFASCSALIGTTSEASTDTQDRVWVNGVRTTDTSGEIIYGSGGCMLQVGKYFYWYGEHRSSSGNFEGVGCYRSTDLVHWENRGDILTKDDSDELNPALIERPKVIYNKSTGKYVLWMHKENADWDYGLAKAAVAEGDEPDGHFEYKWSFRPFEEPEFDVHDVGPSAWGNPTYDDQTSGYENLPYGFMSRDCTLFVDDDGTAYFASSYAENYYMHIYRLTDDYLNIDTTYWPTDNVLNATQREAPCLFKRGDYYYMITSGTSGWATTPTKIQYATDLRGPWSTAITISDTASTGDNSHSDRSQPAYVVKIVSTDGTDADGDGEIDCTYMYMGDRWGPAFGGSSSFDSQFVWAPLDFSSDTDVDFAFSDALKMAPDSGVVGYPPYYEIVNQNGYVLANSSENSAGTGATWSSTYATDNYLQHWRLVPMQRGYQLVNRYTGFALEASDKVTMSTMICDERNENVPGQWWNLTDIGTPYYSIKNSYSGYYMSTTGGTYNGSSLSTTNNGVNAIFQIPWAYRNPSWLASDAAYAAAKAAIIQHQSWKLVQVSE